MANGWTPQSRAKQAGGDQATPTVVVRSLQSCYDSCDVSARAARAACLTSFSRFRAGGLQGATIYPTLLDD